MSLSRHIRLERVCQRHRVSRKNLSKGCCAAIRYSFGCEPVPCVGPGHHAVVRCISLQVNDPDAIHVSYPPTCEGGRTEQVTGQVSFMSDTSAEHSRVEAKQSVTLKWAPTHNSQIMLFLVLCMRRCCNSYFMCSYGITRTCFCCMGQPHCLNAMGLFVRVLDARPAPLLKRYGIICVIGPSFLRSPSSDLPRKHNC